MSAEMETMFYYGATPWHKLGTPVEKALTAEEAITAAGLDWGVEVISLFHNWKGTRVKIDNKAGIRRDIDGRILGVASPQYQPVQNREAFRFFDDVVGTGEAKYETAGSLRNGQKIWMQAKLTDSMNIQGDQVDKYLLLLNGHDGTVALKMFFTPIRVVCMNTLSAAEASAKRVETFYAKHMGNIGNRMEHAREIIGMSNQFYTKFAEQANVLALKQLPAADFPKLLAAAFGTTGAIRAEDVVNMNDLGSARRVGEMEKVQALFEGEGKGLGGKIAGTKWSAYNAIVEHIDYQKQFRGESPEDNRLEYVWLKSPMVKQRAWNYLMKS